MSTEQYAALQKVIEGLEAENATGKIIIFLENGVVKAVEVDKKFKLTISLLGGI